MSHTNSNITQKLLRQTHSEQVQKDKNNDHNTLLIISALGGIDHVLDKYLISNELGHDEINKVHAIITSELTSIKTNTNDKNKEDYNKWDDSHLYQLQFDTNNTFLSALFGTEGAIAINNILRNKLMIYLNVISVSIYVILFFYPWPSAMANIILLILDIYTICNSIILWIPYIFLCILSVNKRAFKMIICCFDFWIKTVYYVIFAVCYILHDFLYVQYEYPLIHNVASVLHSISWFFVIIVASSLDGHSLCKREWKIALAGVAGICFIIKSIYWQFLVYTNHDSAIIYISDVMGYSIAWSVMSTISHSSRIICIFLLKQCVLTYKNKTKSINIIIHPFMSWFNDIYKTKDEDKVSDKQYDVCSDMDIDVIKEIQLQTEKDHDIDRKLSEESISSNI